MNTERQQPRSSGRRLSRRPLQDRKRNGNSRSTENRNARKRRGRGNDRHAHHTKSHSPKTAAKLIPPPEPGVIRIIPLGGVEEIGKNMSAIEIGDDIIVIDAGFQFSSEETPGVDYILPNTSYLEKRKDRVRGVIITHGHLDHIGGIPYVMEMIGNPPIYCRSFSDLMIRKRQEEFPHKSPLDIRVVETTDTVKLGKLTVRFFGITHTIPDSMGVVIETPYGNLINQADFKLDHKDGTVSKAEQDEYDRIAETPTLLLMADSTNIENSGFSTPEWRVHEDLEKIIIETKGRLIIGAFASQIERMLKMIEFAHKHGRKVILEGRSMRTNLEVARLAGMMNVPDNIFVGSEEAHKVRPEKLLILATGSQGEEFAALMRMANGTHKYLKLQKTDTVVLSSSIVPGNELSVAKLKDNIARSGARIITYRTSELYVHGSGHGNREELAWLHRKLKPKFFVPQHGSHYMLRLHAQLAMELGMSEENIIVPDNGMIIEVTDNGTKLVKRRERAASDVVAVDGFNIGDVQDVVMRDRNVLSEEGIFVIILAIDPKTGKLRKSPDIISRGFVYLRESQDLIQKARITIKRVVEHTAEQGTPINFDYLKSEITDHMRKFLLKKTAKRPLVIPVILGL